MVKQESPFFFNFGMSLDCESFRSRCPQNPDLDFDQYLVGDELNFCLVNKHDRPFPFLHIISYDLSLGCKYHFEDFDD